MDHAGCPDANSFDAGELQAALDAADAHHNTSSDADRVLIGPGTYLASGATGFRYDGDPVELRGAGSGSGGTRIRPSDPSASNKLLLTVTGSPQYITGLAVELPSGDSNTAIVTHGVLRDVAITAPEAAISATGVSADGPLFVGDARIGLPTSTALGFSAGISGSIGTDLVVRDSTVAAGWAVRGGSSTTLVQRSTLTGFFGLAHSSATARLESSIVHVVNGGVGVYALAGDQPVYTSVDNVTIVGPGLANTTGVLVQASGGSAHSSTAAVTSTLIRDVGHPFEAETSRAGTDAGIYAEYDDLLPPATGRRARATSRSRSRPATGQAGSTRASSPRPGPTRTGCATTRRSSTRERHGRSARRSRPSTPAASSGSPAGAVTSVRASTSTTRPWRPPSPPPRRSRPATR